MRFIFLLQLILIPSLITATAVAQDINAIKPYFFGAPVENYDSTTLKYFLNDTSLKHTSGESPWSITDYTGTEHTIYGNDFRFKSYPMFSGVDSGVVFLSYSNSTGGLISITLRLHFSDEVSCGAAYDSVASRFKNASELNINDTLYWKKESFNHFKIMFISFQKETKSHDPFFYYRIELSGRASLP